MGLKYKGIYLPRITPFLNNKIDYNSYKKLVKHYLKKGLEIWNKILNYNP